MRMRDDEAEQWTSLSEILRFPCEFLVWGSCTPPRAVRHEEAFDAWDTTQSPFHNGTFPNSYIFSSDTSFSAVALRKIAQFGWFLKKTQKLADIMTEDVEQGAIYPIVTTWTILQMYLGIPTISHRIFWGRGDQLPHLGQKQHCWSSSRGILLDIFSVIAKLGAVWHFLLWVGRRIFH